MAYDGEDKILEEVTGKAYEFGFTTDIESDKAPSGLNENIIRLISAKKNEPEWLLEWRLKAFETWKSMVEPEWPHLCLLYTSPSPRDRQKSRMPSSA